MAQRRIIAGWVLIAVSLLLLFAGGLNVLEKLRAGQAPEPVPFISVIVGAAAIFIGAILLIDGWTARWQAETNNGRENRRSASSRFDAASSERRRRAGVSPGGDRDTFGRPRGHPRTPQSRRALDEEMPRLRERRLQGSPRLPVLRPRLRRDPAPQGLPAGGQKAAGARRGAPGKEALDARGRCRPPAGAGDAVQVRFAR